MPVKVFYNVVHEDPLGWMVAVYFFLSGLACGTFLVSAGARIWGKGGYEKVEKIGGILAPIIMAGGFLFLLLDLAQPFRMWRLFAHFNPGSVASWGVWLANLFLVCTLVHAWALLKGRTKGLGIAGTIGIPLAIFVSGYSGMLLYQMKAHALWHSPLLPVLFSVSALASGLALVILGAVFLQVEKEKIQKLGKVLAALVGFDLVLVLVEFLTLFNGHKEAVEAANLLVGGAYSVLFLGVYVVLGLVVPLLLLLKKEINLGGSALASVLVLIGIMVMRYVMVMGGQHIPLG